MNPMQYIAQKVENLKEIPITQSLMIIQQIIDQT